MSFFLNKNYLENHLCIVSIKEGVNFVSIFVSSFLYS